MSDKFIIGEIAVYQNLLTHPEANGTECEIIGGLTERKGREPDGSISILTCYEVVDSDGVFNVLGENLRKHRPPTELSTWEEVQSITGWSPTKQEVTNNE